MKTAQQIERQISLLEGSIKDVQTFLMTKPTGSLEWLTGTKELQSLTLQVNTLKWVLK